MKVTISHFFASLFTISAGLIASSAAFSQQGGILNDVIQRGTLRIGVQGANPPYSDFAASGEPEGYDVDIGKMIAASLKVKPEWVIVDGPGRITALQTHKADITIADFTRTVERSKVIAFTDPYVVVEMVFTVDASRDDLKTAEDLNNPNVKVGFGRGGTQEQIVPAVVPKASILKFQAESDVIEALRTKRIDALALDNLGSSGVLAKFPGKYKILPGSFSREDICVGLPAGDFDWWRILNLWMHDFNATGENAKLFKKWFGYDIPPIQARY